MEERTRRLRWLGLGLVLLPLFVLVPVALAQGGVVHLTGELQGDQYALANLFSSTVIVDEGTVIHGDLLAVGQTVVVYGSVEGSVMAAGNRVEVYGPVGHAVRIAGGLAVTTPAGSGGLVVGSDVTGDLVAAGGNLDVLPEARIGGNTYSYVNTATLGGRFAGNLRAIGSTVRVAGSVEGDAELRCSPCQVLGGATIGGELTYTSQGDADIIGVVRGAVTHLLPEAERAGLPGHRPGQETWSWIQGVLGLLAVGALLLWLFPRVTAALEEALRTRPGHSVGWGALVLVGLPLAVLLAVGLSIALSLLVRVWPLAAGLGVLALALYGIVLFLCRIVVGYTLGRVVFRLLRWDGVRGARFWEMMLGVVLLSLVVLIPTLGWLLNLAILLFGLGAAVVAAWRMRRRPAEAPVSE